MTGKTTETTVSEMMENLQQLGGGSVLKLIELFFIFLIGVILIQFILHEVRKVLGKSKLDASTYVVILRVTRIIAWIILLMTILSQAGVKMAPFIAALSAVGVAVALALKDSLSNVAGGIILIVTKPFSKGDELEVNGVVGIVDYIDIMTTTLHTFEGHTVIIPNGKLTNSILVNRTKESVVSVNLCFEVTRDAAVDRVKEIIREASAEEPLVLEDPPVKIGIVGQNEKSWSFSVFFYCRSENRWDVIYQMNETIPKALEKAGIPLPIRKIEVVQQHSGEEK